MSEIRTLNMLETPAAVVDLDRMEANLDRMAAYAERHGLALRPHTKTHKSPELAAAQIERGAVGVTVATPREAEVMAEVSDDVFLAYPPVGEGRISRLLALPSNVRITVALDSAAAFRPLARAAAEAGREVGVVVEIDLGMERCGLADPADVVELARKIAEADGTSYRGIMFYPGHVRSRIEEQGPALERIVAELERHLEPLGREGLDPEVVTGGSTPTAFLSHRIPGVTEIRPGTYIFNDRTTAVLKACEWKDCAYTVLATVISTAVAGQAVIDAGSKALAKETIRGPAAEGLGALLDRPEVVVRSTSEEHGILDLTGTDWRPAVGDRVRVVPNHVCVSVNLQERVWGLRDGQVERSWPVAARGREKVA